MVLINNPPPTLSPDAVSLYYVIDELLARSPILIFYGPTATATATANNSRIQAHIFSPAGLGSYPRLTISPSSPLYAAVNCLPREEQGDDISRGLAFSLFKYFAELPQHVKDEWQHDPSAIGKLRATPNMFGDAHAAMLASRMVKVENVGDVIRDVTQGLAEQSISWQDLDVILPTGSMKELDTSGRDSAGSDLGVDAIVDMRYGEYAPLVKLFGDSAFIPTSRLRRAPSRPTGLNRSSIFTRKQKENVRREMCELLDTEENYVSKLYDLLHSVAEDFREKAKGKNPTSSSPSEEALKGLFPQSLDTILEVNSTFLDALRKVVEETENEAIQDIESTKDEGVAVYSGPLSTDVTGSLALATCLRSWFPKFSECYAHYMKAHSQFSTYLKIFMKETGSSFSKRLAETGEQRLMSMLIEPVQRLPRYNLYIDNIIKQLPAKHPALKSLLKARDTISEICSQDSSTVPPSRVIEHLKRIIPSWPATLKPSSRLIAAVDVIEIPPPYRIESAGLRAVYCIILMFTDYLVVLKKLSKASISARGLVAQIDGQDVADSRADELTFRQALEINSFDITEVDELRMIQVLPTPAPPGRPASRPSSISAGTLAQTFYLAGSYEGRANKFMEELVKARIEGRYSEAERESAKFEVRSGTGVDLTFFAGLSDSDFDSGKEGRGPPSKARIWIAPPGNQISTEKLAGVEIYASVNFTDKPETPYSLDFYGPNNYHCEDNLRSAEFLPVLGKRFRDALQMRSQIKNPAITKTLLARNQHLLQSLKIVTSNQTEGPKENRSRPHSPVKMLTSLFGGGLQKENSFRKTHSQTLSLSDIPQLSRPVTPRQKSDDVPMKNPETTHQFTQLASNVIERLEDTLSSYILAILARKGNIVGKSLRMRANADELEVNDLYNALLNNSANYELSAQCSVDVLFCSFEKFIKHAWQERMGPIIPVQTWNDVQAKLQGPNPADFEDTFRLKFGDMSPQNQRALKAIIKLLAELLEGASNDGDRGIMTASFADILVPEGRSMELVHVLDRLVEDIDHLLSDAQYSGAATPMGGSLTSESRHRATNTGSLTSNTSSLRKKFGLLTRKGSKNQNESEPETSVWRTLSKSKHGTGSESSSLSKGSANRTKLDMTGSLNLSPKRPVSRDRPTVLGAFGFENSNSRPLSTIGEGQITGPPRKKRRSSLSDLTALRASANSTPVFSSPRSPPKHSTSMLNVDSPRTPSPTKQSFIPQPASAQSNSIRAPSPKKENSPIRTLPRAFSPPKSRPVTSSGEDTPASTPLSTQPPNHRRRNTNTGSSIPAPKTLGGLSERPTSGNVRKLPPTPSASKIPSGVPSATPIERPAPLNPANSKLRMQSPQKLRARLQDEHKAINNATGSLQDDLKQIGEELQRAGSTRMAGAHHTRGNSVSSQTDASSSEARIKAISAKHAMALNELKKRIDALGSDVTSSLEVSEKRAAALDKLYAEADEENRLLYAQVNDSLKEVFGQVKGGQGVAELKKRAEKAEDEASKLRKENWRLKREVAGLRAQLKD
ncbi:hypothetical protein BT63DRAFT_411163 [Microthyrium microscopicum]|uniref:DH domain-containing protein n=1 Tax=Microthyrium microscopicum TaxID=703497 RepID=A0A6A6UK25_9PEZI|nr:hypothetical protein BT63DRAFT_411163 [Microthyrium microscopicum]